MEEIFKDIPGYEGMYQVSNIGRVKSLERIIDHWRGGKSKRREMVLKPRINGGGYQTVLLYKEGCRDLRIHQLVAITFLDHIIDGYTIVVDHIDGNKLNNRVDNLQLISNRENVSKGHRHKKTSSQYTGVSWHKGNKKWAANIWIDGKLKYLGLFDTELEASEAYQKKLKELC